MMSNTKQGCEVERAESVGIIPSPCSRAQPASKRHTFLGLVPFGEEEKKKQSREEKNK